MLDAIVSLPFPLAVAVAILAAGVMGFAIQRGATCMVAAVDQAVSARRFGRALALAEASLWVAGLLAAARLFGLAMPVQEDFPAGLLALLGGCLLGLGALINGACVFGAIARFGSGDRHYILTPVGFYLGSLLHDGLRVSQSQPTVSPVGHSAGLIALALFLPFLLFRLGEIAVAARRGQLGARIWLAHHATIVIGISFVVLMLVAGPWTYSQVLTRLAHGGMAIGAFEFVLFLALLMGAVIGGWSARQRIGWSGRTAAFCLVGGALMGFGSAMIPGGNDNLILVGLPMVQTYAWVAIGAMAAAITIGLLAKSEWRKRAQDPVSDKLPAG
jgi:toxin CptA